MDRSSVFLDGGYLDQVLSQGFGGARIDYGLFSEALSKGSDRLRTYYYHCMPYQGNPPTDDERARYARMDAFIRNLRRLPRFEVRLGKLERRGTGFEQKRVDVLLSVDLVRMSWDHQIQRAIIVSGDSDYVPAVVAAKDAGVLVQSTTIQTATTRSCSRRATNGSRSQSPWSAAVSEGEVVVRFDPLRDPSGPSEGPLSSQPLAAP